MGESKSYKNSLKKIYIRTFGCQMNVRDSQILTGVLLSEGYELTVDEKQADVVIFNTCAVREHAEDRMFSLLGVWGKRKRQFGKPEIIVLAGCVAQHWKEKVFKKAPYVDIVCGPNDIFKLPYELSRALVFNERHITLVEETKRPESFYKKGGSFVEAKHAFVIIMEGCNNFCSYCIVPYVRGRERSRFWKDVVDEVKSLLDKGVEKITLLGQNVNSYKGGISFPDLLSKIASITGLKELSFITSHPKDASRELFEVMAQYSNIKKCLHLPLQSGSNRILKLMNRNYSYENYYEKVLLYRSLVKGQLTTDLIVGFPTETEEDFQATLKAVREICYDQAYIFKYSPRPLTLASKLKDDLPISIKEDRHMRLLTLQKKISSQKKIIKSH